MKYAVVRTQGHQYKVEEGQDFLVPKAEDFTFEVLLVVDGEKLTVGDPVVKTHNVSLKVTEPLVKGEKIRVFKYKAKSRYRKTIGSRPQYTQVHVESIG